MVGKIKQFINRLDSIGLSNEKNLFIENISLLIASGIDISSSLSAILKETKSRPMKRIISEIKGDVDAGSAFWRALGRARIFSSHTISLIKIGEESGRLEENLKVISIQEEKDREFRSKIRSAMMYPIFVFGLTIVIGVIVAWFILPRLSTVFASMKMDLPLSTRILIASGQFLQKNGFIFIPLLFLALGLTIFFVFFFPRTKFIGQGILFSLPGTRKLMQQVELSRFGYMLGTLINAGININDALRSLIEASSFVPYRNFYKRLLESIDEGNSFQKSFSMYKSLEKLMPFSVQQMVVNGEQSGFLAEVLLKIGISYEKKIEDTTKNLTVILEPVLLVIVWLGVVAVAVAVIMPIYSLIGGFSSGASQKQAPRASRSATPQIVINSSNEPASIIIENQVNGENIGTIVSTSSIEVMEASSSEDIMENKNLSKTLTISQEVSGGLNVRLAPSAAADIIGSVQAGEEYEYFQEINGFYGIILVNGDRGWISSEFAQEKK